MVKRVVTGAHYGIRDWLMQRITALVMAVYTVLFASSLYLSPTVTYDSWKDMFSQGWMRLATGFSHRIVRLTRECSSIVPISL